MTLNELKIYVDHYIDHGHGKDGVRITLSQPSVGGRASVGISGLYTGMDWESGQIRIEPDQKITSYNKDRDEIIPMRVEEYDYPGCRKTIIRSCPKCEEHLKKDAKYCSRCGQRVG